MDPFHLNRIPEFYRNNNRNTNNTENIICAKLREQARLLFLNRLSKETIQNEELQQLWLLLEKNVHSLSNNNNDGEMNDEQMINYLEFNQIRQQLDVDSKLRKYFTATIFARLLGEHHQSSTIQQQQPGTEKISILTFFRYVMRKIWLQQARISLAFCDSTGNGYLTELDLENYIRQLIPTLSKLNNMDKSYYPFYICVTARKFFFILDPHKHNRIRIIDVLFSGLLDELLELRNVVSNQQQQQQTTKMMAGNHRNIDTDFKWFSSANTIRLYNMYIEYV
ncbi:hypothetical protein BLA29_007442 [Euroglyphus maynei]|uniref:Uncharacterized protein n=1 Tax=Euroglyphus maynei TaxID=6958 RepID=A0A1Y3BHV9_EURMA|nr:hypothetical protein BLA29_007442 [Euroglyphus maynei]